MSTLQLLFEGFRQCLQPMVLLACLVGSIMGTLVGVLPGLGPAATLAVLLPLIYGKDSLTSLVMLAGIFYGAMFGGSITSIALNVPGESASVVTTFDGYQMAKQGRAGVAMGIAAIGSFIGGTFGLILLTLVGAPLANAALAFGPSEYLAVYVFTFVAILSLGGGTFLKSAISLFIGLLVSTVGLDFMTGEPRITFGTLHMMSGINYIAVIVGLFGLSEIILTIARNESVELQKKDSHGQYKMRNVFPSIKEFLYAFPSIVRGSVLGFFVGMLPGAGATVATFMSYSLEKRVASHPERYGTGDIRGVAAPETANNAAASGHFVPLLALGIPGSGTMAVLLGGFIMLGIQPGPRLFTEHPDIVWGLIASMYIGNVMLVILNTAYIPFFIWVLRISQKSLPVIVATLCVIGAFSVNNSVFDVFVMLIFAGLGVLFKLIHIPAAPLVVAVILGSELEFAFRQTIGYFQGNFWLSFNKPITAVLYFLCVLLIMMTAVRSYKNAKAKKSASSEAGSNLPFE